MTDSLDTDATGGCATGGCAPAGSAGGESAAAGCGSGGCDSGGCGSGSADGETAGCSSGGCPSMHVYDWLSDMGIDYSPTTVEIVEVSFKGGRRNFFRNLAGLSVYVGDLVVVEADRGLDIASIHMTGELVELKLRRDEDGLPKSYRKLVRMADLSDLEQRKKNTQNEVEAIEIGRRMAERLKLHMKIADVEWQFDRKKITFYFTAERRVDFRELVRDLARDFRTRVELRQIGVRDEAARLGGIGSCGRELCCSTWLEDFKPVSTQAARVQDLPLNPVRLSGQCGRLKCCLNYELEQYMSALERYPTVGARVVIRGAAARVRKVDIFRERLVVESEESGERIEITLGEVGLTAGRSR